MEDEKIIGLYWERNEDAIQETSLKYGKLCLYIAKSGLADFRKCLRTIIGIATMYMRIKKIF